MDRNAILRRKILADRFLRGYIVKFAGPADVGKTSGMVFFLMVLLVWCLYNLEKVHTNMNSLRLPDVNKYDNAGLKERIRVALAGDEKELIFVIDEADGVFPARSYGDKEQQETLLKMWQATKRGWWVLYTMHEGLGVDKLLRLVTQFSLECRIDVLNDRMIAWCINAVDNVVRKDLVFNEFSLVYPWYDREEVVL